MIPELGVGLLLVILTLAVYWQVAGFDFINFDDPVYLTENPHLRSGLSAESLSWAFTSVYAANWHPLTWLSHMLDVALFGMNAGRHHVVSLQLHVLNTLLLFFVLRSMTGARWRSAAVAALFALHPLHVESVVWLSERKDVLSTFFWMLMLAAYNGYVKRPAIGRYLAVCLCLGLGLMAKPMLVTAPLVLLILDYWPLGRLRASDSAGASRMSTKELLTLVWEKIPLFILSLASAAVTLFAQHGGGAVSNKVKPVFRLANAVVAYTVYIRKMIWPADLAVIYPYPEKLHIWQIAAAGTFLVCISVLVWQGRTRRPYLVSGWLWYLMTLVPVIGLIQVGPQAMADRYTYVPLIGLFVAIVWQAASLVHRSRFRGAVLAAGVLLLPLLMAATWVQAGYWKDSATLFERALRVTAHNFLAHNNLGVALQHRGKLAEAIRQYTDTLRINPKFAKAHANLGFVLAQQGRLDEAVGHYLKAIEIDPRDAAACSNLGQALESQGKIDAAARYYLEALQIDPNHAPAQNNYGNILLRRGRTAEAVEHYLLAVQAEPNKEAHYNLGNIFFSQGKVEQAAVHYRAALQVDASFSMAHNNLGVALARQGRAEAAIFELRAALRTDPDNADARKNLERLLAARKSADERLLNLQRTVARNPQDAGAHYELGLIYQGRRQLAEAARHFRLAVSSDPGFAEGLKSLAIVYAMQGEYDAARKFLRRCIDLQPDRWEPYYLTAGIYARQKKTEEAIRWLKQAVAKGFTDRQLLESDRNLEGIKDTAYYQSLMKTH